MHNKPTLIQYRIARAYETLEDARILASQQRWNSTINRLYYAAYYAIMALLLGHDLFPSTHTGAKSNFNQYFINSGVISKDFGKIYSQLFTWRQKGDYDDLFDFNEEKVLPYFEPVKSLIETIEAFLKSQPQ
ncbi:MAG: HEPN domain-containing protein [Spirosomaceae bacterium]|jgi:uncharacterized protein (UPF0332 family)|nr:HEPN domain-containing protein [Spirosomataceae bacterium]